MKKIFFSIALVITIMAFAVSVPSMVASKSVASVEEALGKSFDAKQPNYQMKGVSAKVGEDIVKHGISKRPGERRSKRQSRHFVCTSCHNVEQEDPNLAFPTPEARLNYTVEKGIPFLQATTLYGAVNRNTFYNGDYEKKYGDLVKAARNDIRGAIQLCAVECAQGRKLKDWEIESVLAYLWTIDLKVDDLLLSGSEKDVLAAAERGEGDKKMALKVIEAKYVDKSEATFLSPPVDRKKGVGLKGDPQNGKRLYDNSCLHCHYQQKYSFLHLDNGSFSLNHLNNKAETYNRHSIYQVARYGTFSKYGKKSYMPRYTEERLSDQQLADLRAYFAAN